MRSATLALLGAFGGLAQANPLLSLEQLAERLAPLEEGVEQRHVQDMMAILPLDEEQLRTCATDCTQSLARAWAAHSLGFYPGHQSREVLISALEDGAAEVRKEALEGLAKIGIRSSLNPIMKATAREQDPALRELAQLASQQLVARSRERESDDLSLLDSTDAMERRAAIERVANGENWRTVPKLLEAVEDHHPAVREAAVLALGKLGDDRALPALHRLLLTEHGRPRHAAIGAIAQLANTQSLPHLKPLANSEDVHTRRYVARALGWIPAPENFSTLEALAQDPENAVREEVLLALRRSPNPNTAPLLVGFLQDEAVFLRSEAARLLGETKLELAGAPLILALEDDDALVRINAASSIGRLGEVGAIDALKRRIKKSETPEETAFYKKALAQLGVVQQD
jgi:HEAT repeat protein